ncbi:MAG: DUF1223 domain-containing protein [Gammaproteobacteria bacterium]|nr:DUF1223 domain-containing protein [Gammaproteobacteria bacterium]
MLFVFLLIAAKAMADSRVQLSSENKRPVFIELYTSQGCSSCPPAERWLNNFVDDNELWEKYIPIAFHVDYWDYLGWQDPYASADNSSRQRKYHRQGRISLVYTPGILVNGEEWRGRSTLTAMHSNATVLKASIDNKVVAINYSANQLMQAHVVILGFDIETEVTRGENSNKVLSGNFVSLAHLSDVSNNGQWSIKLPELKQKAQRYGIAVWVNPLGSQKPVQAVGGWLPVDI